MGALENIDLITDTTFTFLSMPCQLYHSYCFIVFKYVCNIHL